MADARPAKTPAEPELICIEEEEILSPEDAKFFRSATGSLLYLSTGTRPDITHSVMVLAKSMSKSGPRAMTKLKRVLGYLKGTVSIKITYSEDADDGINSRHTLTQTTQVTRTRDTRLLELFSISQVAQWTGGLQSKRWWPSQRRSRIRRHVQGVRDGLALSELVGIDELEAGTGNRNVRG